jgi:uncharacterized SAM-binding protein YcdF (DUF218 family)
LFWAGSGLFVGWLAAVYVYYSSPWLLPVDSGKCRAGAIVLLGGDALGRAPRAAELFHAGEAPLIIVSGDGDYADAAHRLRQAGVPESAIRLEKLSGSTMQNARFSVPLLRAEGLTNAIIVTSWFHSRRAVHTFRKVAPDLQFYSRPSYWGIYRSDWARNDIGRHIRIEYVKLLGYWARYGIPPW